MKKIEEYVRSIPDFPEPGIIFRDVTSVLQDADGLQLAIDSMQDCLEGEEFDVITGLESRGFIFGMPIAYNLHKPFVLVRKAGKLPCETVSRTYELEYGSATIEMHKDSIKPGQKVVVIEDLISTGGSSLKAVEAIRNAGCEVVGMVAIFSYDFPIAAERFKKAGVKVIALSNYNAMLEAALAIDYIKESDIETLKEWRQDPENWVPGSNEF